MNVFCWLILLFISCSQLEKVTQLNQESILQLPEAEQIALAYSLKLQHDGWLSANHTGEKPLPEEPISYTLSLDKEHLNSWQEPYSEFVKKGGFYLSRQGLPLDAQGTIEVQLEQNEQLIGYFSSRVHAQKYFQDSSGYFENTVEDKLLIIAYEPKSAALSASFNDRFGFHLYHRYQSPAAYLALGNNTHALQKEQRQGLAGLAQAVIKLTLQKKQFDNKKLLLWDSLNAQLSNFNKPQDPPSITNTGNSIKVKLPMHSHQPWFLMLGKAEKLFIARQEAAQEGSIVQTVPFPCILYAVIEGYAVHSRLLKKLPAEDILLAPRANLIPQLQLVFSKPQRNEGMVLSLNSRALERPMWWFDHQLDLQKSNTVIYRPASSIIDLAIKVRVYDAWENTLTRHFLLPIKQKNISWKSESSQYLVGKTAPSYHFYAQTQQPQQHKEAQRFLWTLFKVNELEQALALNKSMQVSDQATPLFRSTLKEPLKLRFKQAGRYRLHLKLENDGYTENSTGANSYQATFWVNHPPRDLKIQGASTFFSDQESIFVAQISNFKEQEQDGDILHYRWLINGQDIADAGCLSQEKKEILFLQCASTGKVGDFWTLQLELSDGVYPALSAEHRFKVTAHKAEMSINAPLAPFIETKQYQFSSQLTSIPQSVKKSECTYSWQVNRQNKTLEHVKAAKLSYSFPSTGSYTLTLEVECPHTQKMVQKLPLQVDAAAKLKIESVETSAAQRLELHASLNGVYEERDGKLAYLWYLKEDGQTEKLLESHSLAKGMRLQDNKLFWNYQERKTLKAAIRVELKSAHQPPLSSEKLAIELSPLLPAIPLKTWQIFRQIRGKDYLLDEQQQLALPLNTQDTFFIRFFDPQQHVTQISLESKTNLQLFSQLPEKLNCHTANAAGWRRSQVFTLSLAKAGQALLIFKALSNTPILKPFQFKIRPASAVHNITATTFYKKIALQNNPRAEATTLPAGSLIDIEILSSDADGSVYEYRFSSKSKAFFFTHAQKKAYLVLNSKGETKNKGALHSSYILNKELAKASTLSFQVSAHYHNGKELQRGKFYLKIPSWSWSSSISSPNKKLNVGRIYKIDGWQDNIFAASEKGLLELKFHESLGQLTLDRKKLWFAQKAITAMDILDKDLFLVTKDPIHFGYFNQEKRLENMQPTHSLNYLNGIITKLYAFKHSNGKTFLLLLYQAHDNSVSKILLYKIKKDFSLGLSAGVQFPQGCQALAAAHYQDKIFVALHGKGVSSWRIDESGDLKNAQHYGEGSIDPRTHDILIVGNKLFVATWAGLYETAIVTNQRLQFSAAHKKYGEHLMALFSDGASLFVQNYRQSSAHYKGMHSLLHRLQLAPLILQESSFPDDFNVSGSMRLSMYHWQGRYIFTGYEHKSSVWSQRINSCENFAQCSEKPYPESEDFQALNLAWLHPLP